jgi:competence protein ComEC
LFTYTKPKSTGRGAGNPFKAVLYAWRESAYRVSNRIFPQPEAALLNGILLGLDQDIPRDLQQAYQLTGTAHIIAISGFNIAILVALFYKLFGRLFLRWYAALLTVIAITAYAVLAGGEPPVMRAAFMGALVLFGHELGRKSSGLTTLAFSAAVLAFFQPDLPWEASFQLSFAATLGLVIYAGRFETWFQGLAGRKLPAAWSGRVTRLAGELLLVTLAAQVTTLPVLAYHFKRLSLTALLSNPLVLPPQPAVMVLSGIAVAAGLIWLPLGQLLGYLAWPFAAYTNRMVELLARIPGGSVELPEISPAMVLAFYAVLFALTFAKSQSWLNCWARRVCRWRLHGRRSRHSTSSARIRRT